MTESDWLTTDHPSRLFQHVKSRLSARRLQLVACGCCRLADAVFTPDQRAALGVVERHADGLATREEYQQVVDLFGSDVTDRVLAQPSGGAVGLNTPEGGLSQALMAVVSNPADFALEKVIAWVLATTNRAARRGEKTAAEQGVKRRMCAVFREVVGNPFRERRAVAPPEWTAAGGRAPHWMLKVGETARGIAAGVQADQAFDRLPILADALEDDGCTDADLLAHLRGNAHHLRGCWALDLVLGKS